MIGTKLKLKLMHSKLMVATIYIYVCTVYLFVSSHFFVTVYFSNGVCCCVLILPSESTLPLCIVDYKGYLSLVCFYRLSYA